MKEQVQIKVGIKPTFDNTPVDYKILIDDTLMIQSQGAFVSGQLLEHDIDVELDPGPHRLDIRINPTDTQFENIEIVNVSFNEQSLRQIDLFLLSEYLLDQPRIVDGVSTDRLGQFTCIGWAGTYRINFPTPIIPWLLRNII